MCGLFFPSLPTPEHLIGPDNQTARNKTVSITSPAASGKTRRGQLCKAAPLVSNMPVLRCRELVVTGGRVGTISPSRFHSLKATVCCKSHSMLHHGLLPLPNKHKPVAPKKQRITNVTDHLKSTETITLKKPKSINCALL